MTDWTQPDPNAPLHWLELGRALGCLCDAKGCDLPRRARGLCRSHYLDVMDPSRVAKRNAEVVERERRAHGYVPMDDVEWLLECHPLMTSAEMGPRFDVKPATVMTAIRRAGRMDLLDKLVRNAELAGHSVRRAS